MAEGLGYLVSLPDVPIAEEELCANKPPAAKILLHLVVCLLPAERLLRSHGEKRPILAFRLRLFHKFLDIK